MFLVISFHVLLIGLPTDEQGGTEDLFHGYSAGLLTFASIVCYIFMLVGIPGNLITIIALARCKKVSGGSFSLPTLKHNKGSVNL